MPVTLPAEITEPFGKNATNPANITLPIPVPTQVGIDAGLASFDTGFPPATMLPIVAGGIPPYGQDMNGILYMITAHTAYLQAGQFYPFSASVATAIGGYAKGAVVAIADGSGLWISTATANSANPDTAGTNWAPLYGYGHASIAVTNTDLQLTPLQNSKDVIVISGALTANVRINVLATEKSWLIVNNTTGAFTVSVGVAGGGFLAIPAGGYTQPTGVYFNPTANTINPTVSPLSIPIDQAATPLTIAERTNAGYLLATYFNQSSALENPAIGAVFVQSTAADGYLRKISKTNFIAGMALVTTGALNTALAAYATLAAMNSALALKANIASPALTGAPTAPTAAGTDNTTKLATTAYVHNSIGGNGSLVKTGNFNCANGVVTVAFASAFPNACTAVHIQWEYATPDVGWIVPGSRTAAGFQYQNGNAGACTYIAVGN